MLIEILNNIGSIFGEEIARQLTENQETVFTPLSEERAIAIVVVVDKQVKKD